MKQANENIGEKATNLVASMSGAAGFVERIEDVIDQSSRVLIETHEDYDKGCDLLKIMKDLKKDVDQQRLEDTKPLRDAQSEINSRYKVLTDKLEAAIRRVSDSVVKYSAEQRRLEQQRREEEALAKAEEDPEHADAYLDQGTKEVRPDAHTSTYGARTHMQRRLKSVEVVDWSQVPEEYKQLDEQKAKGAIRAGVNIPGLRAVYEETAVSR